MPKWDLPQVCKIASALENQFILSINSLQNKNHMTVCKYLIKPQTHL